MSPLLDLMGRGRPGDGPRQKTVPKPYPGLELAPRRYNSMVVILLMLPLVLVLAELGCALHFSRILAVFFFVSSLAGVAFGRGERAGSHRVYRR